MRIPFLPRRANAKSDTAEAVDDRITTPPEAGYMSDDPVSEAKFDRFGRSSFAVRIAQTIRAHNVSSSIVIGIYGPWGEGKSSTLNFIEAELKLAESIICVRFNPWRFENEINLLLGYFNTVAGALNKELKHRSEKLAQTLKEYGAILAAFGKLGEVAVKMADNLSAVSIDTLKGRIEYLLEQEQKRVVILMDDIDRLDSVDIHHLLKLIRLTADFRYTAYILAFDEEMVAKAIGTRYGGSEHDSYLAGHKFLEKIVHVPLRLPPIPTSALYAHCYELVDQALKAARIQLTAAQIAAFALHFEKSVGDRLKTPRLVKRYANALAFSLAILRNEAYPADLMLIEALRLFYPRVYEQLPNRHDMLLGVGEFTTEEHIMTFIRESSPGLTDTEVKAVRTMFCALFPVMGNSMIRREEQQWSKDKRIFSKDYFYRYFSYAVGDGDVSDIALEKFITCLETEKSEQLLQKFNSLIDAKNVSAVLAKLRLKDGQLSPRSCSSLAIIIAKSGSRFLTGPATSSFAQPLTQSAVLLVQLVATVPLDSRLELISKIISDASPMILSCEFVRCLFNPETQVTIISESDAVKIQKELAGKLFDYFHSLPQPIMIVEPYNTAFYVDTLKMVDASKDLRKYLTSQIQANPAAGIALIKSLAESINKQQELGREQLLTPHLERLLFAEIDQITDIGAMVKKLANVYSVGTHFRPGVGDKLGSSRGDDLTTDRFTRCFGVMVPDDQVAHHFVTDYQMRRPREFRLLKGPRINLLRSDHWRYARKQNTNLRSKRKNK